MDIDKLSDIIADYFNVKHGVSKNETIDMDNVYGLADYIKANMEEKESFDPDSVAHQINEPKHAAAFYR